MKVSLVIFIFCCSAITDAQFFGDQSTHCYNPNQRIGTCVSIYDCQPVMSVLEKYPLQSYDTEFVKASKCNGLYGRAPHVCCTRDTGFTRFQYDNDDFLPEQNYFYWGSPQNVFFPPPQHNGGFNYYAVDNKRREVVANAARGQRSEPAALVPAKNHNSNLLPKECGGVTIANKIYGGIDADLYEFPWMVMLEYKRKAGGISINCAGTLINDRYVLTAAHCVTGRIQIRIGQLNSIRLGEHDQTTQIDCNRYSCAPEVLRVGIAALTPHELYRDDSANKAHDIALIRLDRKVRFTDSMRPICLPSVVQQDQSDNMVAGTRYTVAGWGRTLKAPKSAVKQKLIVRSVDQQDCQRRYRQRNVDILDSQLCAGGEYAKDSCEGDSGGPLMRFRGNAWVLEGIVSFGVKCGLKDMPAVHTRVASYDDWIRSKIRA